MFAFQQRQTHESQISSIHFTSGNLRGCPGCVSSPRDSSDGEKVQEQGKGVRAKSFSATSTNDQSKRDIMEMGALLNPAFEELQTRNANLLEALDTKIRQVHALILCHAYMQEKTKLGPSHHMAA